jgi:hypothetical protein
LPTATAGARARAFTDPELRALIRVAGRLPQRLRCVFLEAAASDASGGVTLAEFHRRAVEIARVVVIAYAPPRGRPERQA